MFYTAERKSVSFFCVTFGNYLTRFFGVKNFKYLNCFLAFLIWPG
jgi:hypothetical protein